MRRCSSVLQRRRRSGPPKIVIRPTNTAPKFANNCDLKTDPSSHRQGAAQRMRTSVKYEEVYLRAYAAVREARISIGRYLNFYNARRPHVARRLRCPVGVNFDGR
ncbi:integrase core domain-containing protein [Sphingobium sp. AS12]|uniref:integrase core domain-containing protein n=1 Tax=Sphingobium sp. AS12 TaxID=2849495 RepID=UPI0026756352|nr:integrase core domain-containing protein [Sphingobium sp. AS12]